MPAPLLKKGDEPPLRETPPLVFSYCTSGWKKKFLQEKKEKEREMAGENFLFVFLPVDGPLQEISGPLSGGLENDYCQNYAKAHFADGTDGAAMLKTTLESFKTQNQDINAVSPKLMETLRSMGASVEICAMSLPSKDNSFIGVSFYCDANGIAKGARLNARATDLARCCGNTSIAVYGDVFVGRYYDNEEEAWSRVSIREEEIRSDAPWVMAAQKANAGRNMANCSTSGLLAQYANAGTKQPTPSATPSITSSSSSSSPTVPKNISWIQIGEELEIQYRLPTGATKRDVTVKFKASNLLIKVRGSVDGDGGGEGEGEDEEVRALRQRLAAEPSGAELFGKVCVDDCTWTVEARPDLGAPLLVVSMTKQSERDWDTLLK